MSGGFDSFGIRREDFFAQNSKGESFIDTIMRYGQMYQTAKNSAQNSLFGGFDSIEIATPAIPKTDEYWSDIERLNKERDLVGIYLSAHPLDEYKIILDNLCNTSCTELADRCAALHDRDDITLGGIVTGVQTRFSKNNKPWGIITLEDFNGSGELVLFGDDWLNLNGKFIEGAAVYITGKMTSRFYNSDQKELKVSNVELLQSIKDKALTSITISMTVDLVDETVINELGELITSHPGPTQLYFMLHDSVGKKHVLLQSNSKTVEVNRRLIQYIEKVDSLDYKIN